MSHPLQPKPNFDELYSEAVSKFGLPPIVAGGLCRYICDHIETGGFLRSILENDLKEACILADVSNRGRLFDIIKFLYGAAPIECWGSSEAVTYWLRDLPIDN